MRPTNVITVVVDRLHAGMIGAYGNSWIRTAALDQLASESFLFDQALTDSPLLEPIYRGYWLGIPATYPAAAEGETTATLPRLVQAAGIATALVTDEPDVVGLPWASDFGQRVQLEPSGMAAEAQHIGETEVARLFGAATDWLAGAREPFFLWVHARGMAGPWDAPWELRQQFADDEDPPPPRMVDAPDCRLAEDFDPDELLGIVQAYAGQVAVLDACLAAFLYELARSPMAASTQLNFLSARGFPLGEHLSVGTSAGALYNELVQTAWLMRFPDRAGAMVRTQALVRPSDLPGTLVEALGLDCGAGRRARRACWESRAASRKSFATTLRSSARPSARFARRPGFCAGRPLGRSSCTPSRATAGRSTKSPSCAPK